MAQDTQPIAQNAVDAQYHTTRASDSGLLIARNAMPLYLKNSNIGSVIGGTPIDGRSGTSLGTDVDSFANLSPAAGTPLLRNRKALFAFGTGGIGQENNFSNQGYNGISGMLFELDHGFAIGIGASGSYNNFETRLGGDTRTSAFGGTVLGSFESQDTPWRAYASAGVIGIDARFNRNYVNGGGVDTSRGNTDGIGYGVATRVGYEKPINEIIGLMPYGELQYAHTKLNAYTETGGGFPATIGEQESNTIVSKFGGELSYKATAATTWCFRGAWAHQYGGTAPDVNVTVAGIGQNIAGAGGDRDWMEAGASIHHNATDRLLLIGDITGRTGERSEPAIAGTVGVIWFLN